MSARRWLPPLLWAGVIIFATSMPSDLVPQQVSTFDKAAHFGMYAVLGALLTRHLSEITSPKRAFVAGLLSVAVFAAVDEWHQQFIPGRSAELADWVADSLGAASGAMVMSLLSKRTPIRPSSSR